jgi:N,N'-diacetyllegionaminate synthase
MTRILALVPARGGSKGFPGKNLALLAGEPLVRRAWRTLAALRRRHPELLLHLSTDDAAIAAAWPEAERPRQLRPAELAGDTTPTLDVAAWELQRLARAGTPCDAVLLLQPTSPLIDVDDLDRLLAALPASGSAICVRPTEHPPWWAMGAEHGRMAWAVPREGSLRRQDLPDSWMPVGVAAARTDLLLTRRTFNIPGVSTLVEVPAEHGIDIDHREDLERCEALLAQRAEQAGLDLLGRRVGPGQPCFVIAEAGVNHNGDPALAVALVDAAADSGADAVKFQTFSADAIVTADARKADYQVANTGGGSQRDMLRALELPWEAWQAVKRRAAERGIAFLSTPFDPPSADLLRRLGLDAFKISSGDLTCHPLLQQVAAAGRPMILSTGMADLDEVADAVELLRGHPIALLHCVSCYPAPPDAANLRAIGTMARRFAVPVGWSDHTPGWEITVAAVARGACIVEKHLTTDCGLPGPDHKASLDPAAFAAMMRAVRAVEQALGDGRKHPHACEREATTVARKSLVAARDLPAGHVLAAGDLACMRPGDGIAPARLPALLGRRLAAPLAAHEALAPRHIDGGCP